MNRLTAALCLLLPASALLAQSGGPSPAPAPQPAPAIQPGVVPTLLAQIQGDKEFSSLAAAVKEAHLESLLSGGGTMTLFAPTNGAFAKLSREERSALLTEKAADRLTNVLKYHILFDRYDPTQLAARQQVTTSDNRKMAVVVKGGVTCLGPGAVKANHPPVQCLNGILYPVDDLLMPAEHDLLDVIDHDPTLSLFSQMLKLTGMDATLHAGRGRYTVLAPTDEALQARLDPEYLRQVMMPERAFELNKIVRRHVFSGTIPAKILGSMKVIPSLSGEKAPIAVIDGVVTVNGARLVRTDIPATNGMLDVIDNIIRLVPPDQDLKPVPPPLAPPLSTDPASPKPATPSDPAPVPNAPSTPK